MKNENSSNKTIEYVKRTAYGLAAGSVIFLSVLSLITAREQEYSAARINLAGRQRMLSQKLMKEVLLFETDRASARTITNTITVFDTTLHALIRGGEAPSDLDEKRIILLPPEKNREALAALDKVENLWLPFKARIEGHMLSRKGSGLGYIIDSNVELLNRIEDSVYALQKNAEKNNYMSRLSLAVLIVVLFGLTGAGLFVKIRQLRAASLKIKKLEQFLPLCSYCKKIRTRDDAYDQESWVPLELYLYNKDGTSVSHGMCPACVKELYPEIYEKIMKKRRQEGTD
jgi:hypothetical protein